MKRLICHAAALAILLAGGWLPSAQAQSLDQIGVTLLRAVTTNLNGAGIRVAQPEASAPTFEVNPAAVGQPTNLFTYASAAGTDTNYPNSVGTESGHADNVAQLFYGIPTGVATNVAHVDSFDADYFIQNYLLDETTLAPVLAPLPFAVSVVNQSFTFGSLSVSDQQSVDSAYDDYAEIYATLFVSAACNYAINPQVCAPGTAYNCISVGAYGGDSSIGPTIDNGRCKPDLTAPAGETSFSTPQVAGAAAVLMQAALRGDGGSDTNSAFDMRTIKALLLNGAVKPAGWTNSNSSPLDTRYGAGVLNIFNSYKQLAGGKQIFCAPNLVSIGSAHLPVTGTNSVAANSGWDFENIDSTATNAVVNHYFFNATNGFATATLVWNRQFNQTNINDLDLFLYNCANSNLVACSTSRVDNVEHFFVPKLSAGRYDLQVLKNGGTNVVSDSETYALAWAFVSPTVSLTKSGMNAVVTWPVYPAGFLVETATNLAVPVWTTNSLPPSVLTNSQNSLIFEATNGSQFFRLRQPNF